MNLREVLLELGIKFKEYPQHHHISSPDWYAVDCFQCSPNSDRYRLGLNNRFNYATCWICGPLNLYQVLVNLSGKEAGIGSLLKGLTKERRVRVQHSGRLQIPAGVGPLGKAHLAYLKRRRIDAEELVGQWGVQGIGIAPVLAWRLFIPVFHQGQMVSWTTRAIGDSVVRYKNAREDQESLPMKHTLLGLDKVAHCIVLVEGFFDAVRIGKGAAATMGVIVTREQLGLIAKVPIRVIVFDSDDAGQKAAKRLCTDLEGLEGQTHRVELDAKDPSEASDREINSIRNHFLE